MEKYTLTLSEPDFFFTKEYNTEEVKAFESVGFEFKEARDGIIDGYVVKGPIEIEISGIKALQEISKKLNHPIIVNGDNLYVDMDWYLK